MEPLKVLKAVKFKVSLAQQRFKEAVLHKQWPVASSLLKRGEADIDYAYPPFGNTLFLELVELYSLDLLDSDEAIKWLEQRGADINAVNNLGNNAAILAAFFNNQHILDLLKDLGVDFKRVNHDNLSGETLLRYKRSYKSHLLNKAR